MSASNSLPSPPLAEPQTIDTIPLTSPKQSAPEELFDSNDTPDVKHYFTTPIGRMRRPKKPTPKSANQDLSFSASTVDTDVPPTTARESPASSKAGNEDDNVTASQSLVSVQDRSEHDEIAAPEPPAFSQDSGKVDESFTQRKTRPRSDIINMPVGMSEKLLEHQLATEKVKNQRLEQSIISIQVTFESEKEQREELDHKLKIAKTTKTGLMRRTEKAEAKLAEMEVIHDGVISRNAELEELNKALRRQTAQAWVNERDCKLLNATQANQMQELKEEVFRKEKLIEKLGKQWDNREVNQELQDELLALARDLDMARSQIQEQQTELGAIRIRIQQFEEQQVSLEDETFQYDGGETTSPFYGSPAPSPRRFNAHSRRWVRRMAESQTLQNPRLSDTPALTDDASTRSTTSLASPQPVDSAGGSDLPKTDNEVMPGNDQSNRSGNWAHETVYQWPSDSDRRPYRIVGRRPRDLRDVIEEVEANGPVSPELPSLPADADGGRNEITAPLTTIDDSAAPPSTSTNDAGTQTAAPPVAAPPTTTNDSGTQSTEPLVVAPSVFTPGAARAARPLWHHIALGSSLLFFLVGHAFFVEKRFWGSSNELSRRVVASMRDEWWGSPWVERIGYTLDQTLAVDRTGFC